MAKVDDIIHVFELDISGSVDGKSSYFIFSREKFYSLPKDKTICCVWDTNHRVISYKEMERMLNDCKGYGGTDPSQIAIGLFNLITTGKITKGKYILHVITDGQARPDEADEYNKTKFGLDGIGAVYVNAYIYDTGGTVNRGCIAPFMRTSPSKMEYLKDGKIVSSCEVTPDDYNCLSKIHTITTYKDLESNIDSIDRAIKTILVGLNADSPIVLKLINDLENMKKRIIKFEADVAAKSHSLDDIVSKLSIAINTIASGTASPYDITQLLDMIWSAHTSNKILSRIDHLIGYIKNEIKNLDIDIKVTPAERFAAAEEAEVVEPIYEDTTGDSNFECPISFEETGDMVMMMKPNGILKITTDKVTMDNFKQFYGMNQVTDPDIITEIGKCFLQPISAETFLSIAQKQPDGSYRGICPFTREVFGTAISLSTTPEALMFADRALAENLTQKKKVIPPVYLWGMLAYLAYHNMLPLFVLEHYKKKIIELMIIRGNTTIVPINLFGSRIPNEPIVKLPLFHAIYLLLESPMMMLTDDKHPVYNHILRFAPNFNYMKTMLLIANISLPENAEKNYSIYNALIRIMKRCKKPDFKSVINKMLYYIIIPKTSYISKYNMLLSDKLKTPSNIAISQLHTSDSLIDAAETEFPKMMSNMTKFMKPLEAAEIIRYIVMNVNPKLTVSQIYICPNTTFNIPTPSLAFALLTNSPGHIDINDKTCRPTYIVKDDSGKNVTWKEKLSSKITPVHLIDCLSLSIYELYGMFVDENEQFPTVDDLIVWAYYKRVMNGIKRNALPKHIKQYCTEVYEDFKRIRDMGILPKEFSMRRAASTNYTNRERIEKS